LVVSDESRVTVETLTISGGFAQNITCVGRSRCVLRNVTVEGGGGGIGVQDQSAADILGASVIRNSTGAGVGVYGASAVNIRPEPWITGQEVGPVISGHAGQGAWVQDGSFLRSDNTTFSGNGIGIVAQRNAVLKIYSSASQSSIGGVINNTGDGIIAKWSATASVSVPISGNGGAGVKVGPLTFFQEFADVTLISGNGQGNVVCQHPTAISVPFSYCGH
jgi:hypothetical protein